MSVPVSPTPEPRREVLLTAQEWCEALGWHILDPDGWREDGTPWLAGITRKDFERRAAMSTARGPGYWPDATPVSSPTPDEQAAEERRAETQALLEVNATLHAKATHLETLLRTMDHFADVAEVCEAKSNDYAARLVASEAALVVVREQLTQAQAEVELQRSLARGHELHRANAERREAAQHAWAEDYRQQRDAAQARIAAVEALCDEAEAGMLRDGYRTELPVWGAPTVTAVVRAALNPPPSPPTYTTEEPSSHE